MASLAASDVLETCSQNGPVVIPDAVVSVEADLLLGDPTWDEFLEEDPEAFYRATPWRHANVLPSSRFTSWRWRIRKASSEASAKIRGRPSSPIGTSTSTVSLS
jgi:hypothetical protein